ncbi:hypothetical protein [Actinoallomurus acanthiterrae]
MEPPRRTLVEERGPKADPSVLDERAQRFGGRLVDGVDFIIAT